jgi:hypothetical protein
MKRPSGLEETGCHPAGVPGANKRGKREGKEKKKNGQRGGRPWSERRDGEIFNQSKRRLAACKGCKHQVKVPRPVSR